MINRGKEKYDKVTKDGKEEWREQGRKGANRKKKKAMEDKVRKQGEGNIFGGREMARGYEEGRKVLKTRKERSSKGGQDEEERSEERRKRKEGNQKRGRETGRRDGR